MYRLLIKRQLSRFKVALQPSDDRAFLLKLTYIRYAIDFTWFKGINMMCLLLLIEKLRLKQFILLDNLTVVKNVN